MNRYTYNYNNPANYIDSSGHDPWWCGDSNCATSYVDSMSNGPNETNVMLLIVCGFRSGKNCDVNYATEDGNLERPFEVLANEWENTFGAGSVTYMGFDTDEARQKDLITKEELAIRIYEEVIAHPNTAYYFVGHSAGPDAIAMAVLRIFEEFGRERGLEIVRGVAFVDPYFSARIKGVNTDTGANSYELEAILGDAYDCYLASGAPDVRCGPEGDDNAPVTEVVDTQHTYIAVDKQFQHKLMKNLLMQ